MADLRLIAGAVAAAAAAALAAATLAGCDAAGAATGAGSAPGAGAVARSAAATPAGAPISPPAGWQAMPAIAAAARAALGAGVRIEGAEAWGEPAMGCYAVWLALGAAGSAEAIARQVVAGFAGPAAGSGAGAPIVVTDVAAPAGETGVLALAFERGEHRGRLRARIGGEKIGSGNIDALACFANQREPRACEAACGALLGALP